MPMNEAIDNVIFLTKYGSDIFGTTTDDSDNDQRGIYLPSVNDYLSLCEFKTYNRITDDVDLVLHPFKKYVKLASCSNPSCIEWLFVGNEHIINITDAGKKLLENKHLFLSREIYFRFSGFAKAEYKRIFSVTGRSGAKRKEKHLKYGYDPKSAMNVIRLLEEGIELLKYQKLSMPRQNADFLIAIKLGEIPLETIKERIYGLEREIEKAFKISILKNRTDLEDINNFIVTILRKYGDY